MSRRVASILTCVVFVFACSDDTAGESGETSVSSETEPGDGDGDSTAGDGDGDGGGDGDGDGDPTDGDGDGDPATGDGDGDGDGGPLYPDPDWPTGEPEDHGLSSAGLDALADAAEGFNSNCMLVIHDGVLVGEWYWNGYDVDTDQPNVFSVTKSFTSALVGIAMNEGLLDIGDDAADYISEWIGTPSEVVSVRDLLANGSGRQWDFTTDYLSMTAANDQTQFAIDLEQQHAPGDWWEYNNSAIQTLERVLEVASGEDVEDYAQAKLLEPIGASVTMGRDGAGNPQTYQGISASCDDLARFGYLYLREGQWANGVQVIPPGWIEESLTPSTPLNSAYGFLWWLNVEGHWVLPSAPLRDEGDGRLLPSAPEDLYAAVGALGQVIAVEPSAGYVLVRLGDAPDLMDLTGFGKLGALWDAFEAAKL